MSLPTIDDLKLHLNMTGSDQDDELIDMLDASVELAEGVVGPLSEGAVTETHYGLASDELVLKRMPVAEVTAVSSWSYGVTTPLTLADYQVDTATGIVRAVNGSRFYGGYTVTYSTGRAALPASIKLAILIIAGHLWETQRGTSPSALSLQQFDADPSAGPVGAGYAIPNRARELLAAYVSPVIA